MTALDLLTALRSAGCEPSVAGPRLALRERAPAHLHARLAVLHTGVRAHLGNRCWYGHADDGAAATRVMLNPSALVPAWVKSLSVEGDLGARDKVPANAKTELPELFAYPTRTVRRRTVRPAPHLTGMGPDDVARIADLKRAALWR